MTNFERVQFIVLVCVTVLLALALATTLWWVVRTAKKFYQ
jgi:flagellar basal body-associated protein FliL